MSGNSNTTPKRYPFREEDRDRINRLLEEIRGRLEEVALISARYAGFTLTGDMVRKFDPTPPIADAAPYKIEVVCPFDDGPCGCIVLMDDGNHFFEYPCGSGG